MREGGGERGEGERGREGERQSEREIDRDLERWGAGRVRVGGNRVSEGEI